MRKTVYVKKPNQTLNYYEKPNPKPHFDIRKEMFALLHHKKIFEGKDFSEYLDHLKKYLDQTPKTEYTPLTTETLEELNEMLKPNTRPHLSKFGISVSEMWKRLNKKLSKEECLQLIRCYMANEWRNTQIPYIRYFSLIMHLSKTNYYYLTKQDMKRLKTQKPFIVWKPVISKEEKLIAYVQHGNAKEKFVSESDTWKHIRKRIFHKAKMHFLISGFKPYKHKYGRKEKFVYYTIHKSESGEPTEIVAHDTEIVNKWFHVTSDWSKGLSSDTQQDTYFKPKRNQTLEKETQDKRFLEKWLSVSKFAQENHLTIKNI